MNATQIAYLEARIEEERYRKIEEAEAAYRRDMEALDDVRGLYERYGAIEVEEAASPEPAVEAESVEETGDPPDAGGPAEEEQRAEGEASEMPVKPCKECGATKPLDEFPKQVGMKDGRRNECKACRNRLRAEKLRAREHGSRLASEVAAVGAEERPCANGSRCVEALGEGMGGEPAILRKGYEHDTCTSCRKRAGVAA